jgi:hypothetical protein
VHAGPVISLTNRGGSPVAASGAEECGRHDADAVLATVRVGAGGDDERSAS